jgi:hypothetical protein
MDIEEEIKKYLIKHKWKKSLTRKKMKKMLKKRIKEELDGLMEHQEEVIRDHDRLSRFYDDIDFASDI